jgi:general secretion pathway protein A
MYEQFYGLKEKPFNPTPDPKFLYLTPSHREALAQLIYGVQEQRGFLVLTGEVGTGKTTLLHTLLQKIDASTAVAFIYNSTLTFDEILEYMLKDFGVAVTGDSRVQRLMRLNDFLIERRRAGLNTVVIFDEAQNLEAPILEQIRLLSNFETATNKLLQILLVGQPELKGKLMLPELRQLKQRIGLRCAIQPLTPEEARDYVINRLRVAGGTDLRIFEAPAIRRITEYAGGVPRVINMVCDHCLLSGYALRRRRIGQDIVEQAIEYLEEGTLPSRIRARRRRPALLRWLLGTLAAGTAAAGILASAHASVGSAIAGPILDLARAAKAWLLP